MKKKIATALAALTLLLSGTSLAGGPDPVMPPPKPEYPEWYIGAGPSWHAITRIHIPNNTNTIDTGWHVLAGINATEHLGAEINYTDLGDITVYNTTPNELGRFVKFRYWTVSAYGLYRFKIIGPLQFFAKLGFGYTELFNNHNFPANQNDNFLDVETFSLVYGAGLGLRFGQFAIRAMYTVYDILDFLDTGAGGQGGPGVLNDDSLDLSVIWYFRT